LNLVVESTDPYFKALKVVGAEGIRSFGAASIDLA